MFTEICSHHPCKLFLYAFFEENLFKNGALNIICLIISANSNLKIHKIYKVYNFGK